MPASRIGPRGNRRDAEGKFSTDTDISHAAPKTERSLQAWSDNGEPGVADDVANMTLEETSDGRSWNQFAVNKKKFGVVPTYDEKLYTTEINVAHPDFAAREKRAAQIAREIESGAPPGSLSSESYGDESNDSDEEEMFSGVARNQPAWNRGKSPQDFAAEEANRAMSSPDYLAKSEAAERKLDEEKFVQAVHPKDTSKTSPQPSASADSASGSKSPEKSTSPVEKSSEHQKKKFNFSAASVKKAAFRRNFSASPGQSFSPVVAPAGSGSVSPVQMGRPPVVPFPGMFPGAIPGAIPGALPAGAVPYGGVVSPPPGIAMPIPYGSPLPSVPPTGAEGHEFVRETGPVDVSNSRPLEDADFNYMQHLKDKKEPVPKIYFTSPTWSNNSSSWYVDQFPVRPPAPRMQMFVPPVGFMMPPRQFN